MFNTFKRNRIKRLFEKYRKDILGLKIRQSKEKVGDMNIEPVKEAIKLAEEIGVNVVVNSTNPPVEMTEFVKVLRKGDVITHSFHGIGNTIINSDGNVYDEIKEAQSSGVIFDVANARFYFAFKVAEAALKDGFLPDVISTDLTVKSLYKKPQAFNMMFLLSKYLNLGLSLSQIIERTTIRPAKIMNMEKIIGTLSKNSCADVAIIKEIKKDVVFEDWKDGKLKGNRLLRNMATIREGEIVFRDIEI